MKKLVFTLIFVNLFAYIIAGELVMLKTKTSNEVQFLSQLDNLTINYLGNGFVIGTKTGNLKEEFILIENNAWQSGQNYFLIHINQTKNTTYLGELMVYSQVLFQSEDLTLIRVTDEKLSEVAPPVDGSIARVWNKEVKLPSAKISFPENKADPDPFIVARLAEVNTTLMQTNLQHLQDYGTRNAYNAQSVVAQNWIKQQFENYGLSTQLFDFTMPGGSASDNVIATKTGTLYPNEYVIIGGHYDSYAGSSGNPAPGADDNASGTCGVLEVARILAPYSYDRTIIFCAFSGEEYGLYGSAAYATWCDNQNLNILGYLNMDMIGYLKSGDPIHTDIIAPASAQDLVDYYTSVVNLYLPDFITGPGMLSGGDSDHTSFNNHGFMGIFPFEDSEDYSPYIHSANDLIGNSVNNFTQVGVFTKAILATTVSLANMVPPQLVNVTGVVTDQTTGMPISGATVEVLNEPISPVTTNASGQYTITNILEGIYDFRISKAGYATTYQEVEITINNLVFNFQLGVSAAWSFETGVFEPQWTFSGSAPWYITNTGAYDGQYCSRSGAIGDNAITDMSITLTFSSGGYISFFRKVSSEANYDYLRFYIDGVQQGLWAGEVAWGDVFYPVTAGTHTMKWSYTKDANTIGGSDAAWVDFINFPPYIPLPEPADISVYPASFEVTIPVDATASQQMNVSNSGDLDLNYSITTQYVETIKAPMAYCTSVGGGGDEFIQNVTFGSINNSTSQSYYANYTALSTSVDIGLSYPITIVNGDPNWSTDQCGIWIDWNQNESFTDDGTITVNGSPGVGPYTATIIPPENALSGPTRMRVQIIYSATPNPCQASFSYGEVEDYTVIVNGSSYSWLTVSPTSGTVTGQGNSPITLTYNSQGLAEGDYYANVKISSNDPDESLVIVPCTLHVANQINVELTAMLEGPFAGTEMQTILNTYGMLPLNQPFNTAPWNYSGTESVPVIPNANVVDWVLVELRDATSAAAATSATRIARQAAFILKDGSIVGTDGTSILQFNNSINQQLFIVIYHRNHLGILSANALSQAGGVYTYNFTNPSGQAFGGTEVQKQVGEGIWALIGGDGNSDGSITIDDIVPEWQIKSGTAGFIMVDYNLDGQVDNQDKDDCWSPNLGIESVIPE